MEMKKLARCKRCHKAKWAGVKCNHKFYIPVTDPIPTNKITLIDNNRKMDRRTCVVCDGYFYSYPGMFRFGMKDICSKDCFNFRYIEVVGVYGGITEVEPEA